MRVGWLVDHASHTGGAELTQAEFRAAAPDTVEIIDCRPGEIHGCDLYVVQNCVQYTADDIKACRGAIVKYWHDVGPHLQPGVMDALAPATHICCSPIQADYMGLTDAVFIPPPVDLSRFDAAAAQVNGDRKGSVSVGSWRNFGKAPHKAAEWAKANGETIDFYGDGVFRPHGSEGVPYDRMPGLLARYERFVFLPMVLEPFGRLVVEAWASGCECIVNGLVGARYWIEKNPEGLETAAHDFWAARARVTDVTKIVIPRLDGPGPCELALREQGISYEARQVGAGDEYARMLGDLWREGDGFLMIEHDIIPRGDNAVQRLCKCRQPWCTHAYMSPTRHISLGVLKLTTTAVRKTQDMPSVWEGQHWSVVDSFMVPELLGRLPLHCHFPPFGHQRFDG